MTGVEPGRVNRESWANALQWLCQRIVDAVNKPGYEAERRAEIAQTLQWARSLTPPAGVDAADAVIVTLAAMVHDRDLVGVAAWGDELDRVTT